MHIIKNYKFFQNRCHDDLMLTIAYRYSSSTQRREIIPFDKWELLPEQVEHQEELGRGAFGVVYKAILKKRPGIELFDNRKGVETNKATQVVAVKELQGIAFS